MENMSELRSNQQDHKSRWIQPTETKDQDGMQRTSDDDWDLATNMKGLRKSHDRSCDGHVRDGEWPEATTPCAPLQTW